MDRWLLTVDDNGIGIDPQYADRIFTIFQRLHLRDQYGGTGHRAGAVPQDRRLPQGPDLAGGEGRSGC